MKFMILALALVSPSAFAMPNATRLSCEAATDLVASHGAIVLRTGAYTYDRFVAHGGYCGSEGAAKPAWIATADSAQCFVGYYCGQDNRGNSGN